MKKEISFGEYFDAQRDKIIKDMQNKNAQQNIEWMEDYEKRRAKRVGISDTEERLWQSHKFPEA